MGNPAELPPTPAELLENECKAPAVLPSPLQPLPTRGFRSLIGGLPFRKSATTSRCAPSTPNSAQVVRRGVLLAGDFEKWTNYFGQWKLRSYEIVPGSMLVYDSAREGHSENIPLLTCTVKSVKQVEAIVYRSDGGPLKLRFASNKIRSRWLSIIVKAKQMACGGGNYMFAGASPSPMSPLSGGATPNRRSPTINPTEHGEAPLKAGDKLQDEEAVAITRLIDSLSRARSDYFSAREEVDVISRRLLEHLKDATPAARELTCSMLVEQERLDTIVQRHFAECNVAIQQEQVERADLQKCLRLQARDNYKLGHKLQRVPRNQHGPTSRNSVSRRASGEEFFDMDDCTSSAPTFSDDDDDDGSETQPDKLITTSTNETSSSPELRDVVEQEPLAQVEELGLPRPNIKFRTILPKPRTEFKTSLWSLLKDFVGKDLSRIALPVTFNEPNSMLQRLAEDYQYCQLLERAGSIDDPALRLLYVAAFTITPWQSAVGRTYKPFNPLLGETYEMTHRGFNFMAEQVGHHPPVAAYHTAGKSFEAYGHIAVDTKFTGKALEVHLVGPTTINVKHPAGHFEAYSYRRPRLIVNNIIFGRISLDVAGTYTVTNHNTGDYAVVEYPRSGWWGESMQIVRAAVYTSAGECAYRISGQWSSRMYYQEVPRHAVHLRGSNAIRLTDAGEGSNITKSSSGGIQYAPKMIDFVVPWKELETQTANATSRLLWAVESRPACSALYYSFGAMTFELNDFNKKYYDQRLPNDSSSTKSSGTKSSAGLIMLPATDSRRRPDQRALEEGNVERSNIEKVRLEEKQRAAARARGSSELTYKPQWFVKSTDKITGEPTWDFNRDYWLRQFQDTPDIMGP